MQILYLCDVDAFDRSFDAEPIHFPWDCHCLAEEGGYNRRILMRGARGGNDLRQRFRTSAPPFLVGGRVWKMPQRQAWRLDRRVMLIPLSLCRSCAADGRYGTLNLAVDPDADNVLPTRREASPRLPCRSAAQLA